MYKTALILSFILVFSCNNQNGDHLVTSVENFSIAKKKQKNRYGVKSGIIRYKITISGIVMDNIINGNGIEKLYFDNWGNLELKEELITKNTKVKIFNDFKEEQKQIHHLQKTENNVIYQVNFDQKNINKSFNTNVELVKFTNKDLKKVSSILHQFGGIKIGNEIFKGYDCEIWDISGSKQWLYKGVPLKIEHTIMGVKTIKEAISANFNVIIINNEFELPNFLIVEQ